MKRDFTQTINGKKVTFTVTITERPEIRKDSRISVYDVAGSFAIPDGPKKENVLTKTYENQDRVAEKIDSFETNLINLAKGAMLEVESQSFKNVMKGKGYE